MKCCSNLELVVPAQKVDKPFKLCTRKDMDPSKLRSPIVEAPSPFMRRLNEMKPKWTVAKTVQMDFMDVGYQIKVGEGEYKDIVRGATGTARPGELLAIMGPSGCGKTTLLNVLSGRAVKERRRGTILVNNAIPDSQFKKLSGYVQQDDTVMSMLTVREALRFAADLKLPSSMTTEEKHHIVEDVIEQLGLNVCADTKAGNSFIRGISGGQKKRLSIGLELVSRPSLIFLDSPTNGLDSSAAVGVLRLLKILCKSGCTIIATVNQPPTNVYELFDYIYLMAAGETAYYGPRIRAVPFFAELGMTCPLNSNPSDFFLNRLNTDYEGATDVAKLLEAYRNSRCLEEARREVNSAMSKSNIRASGGKGGKKIVDEERYPILQKSTLGSPSQLSSDLDPLSASEDDLFVNGFLWQLQVLLRRNQLNAMRNPINYWLRVGMYGMLGIVLGSLYFDIGTSTQDLQDRISVLFFVAAFCCFMTVAAIPAFLEDQAMLIRERGSASYGVTAYTISHMITSAPWIFLISVVLSIPTYYMIGLHSGGDRFIYFLCLVFLALYTAESLVVAVSAIIPVAIAALAIACALQGLYILLCGFFVIPPNIPDYWIWLYYLSFQTYALEGLLYNDLEGLDFKGVNGQPDQTGLEALDSRFDITEDRRPIDCAVLIVMAVFYRALFAFLIYKFQTGKK